MPNDKRARHKAHRQVKMAELRRAQQRRRNLRRGGVVGGAVVIALVLALVTSGAFSSGKKKTTVRTASGSTTTSPPTTAAAPTTTVPLSAAKPLPLASVEAALTARTPPARSATCTAPMTGKAGATTTTTTTPASGKAVSIVPAPAGVGFPSLDGSAPRYTKFAAAPPFCINVDDVYTATMKTTAGTIEIELLPKYAPLTVNNFVFLAGYHYFDGTVFHRVIPGFVDQGGDPTATGTGSPGYSFADELPKATTAYDAGSVAMANSGANTNGSQFFLVVGSGGKELTPAYTMYGQIVGGLSVANEINAGGDAADNGSPPKISYKILSVHIHVGPPGSSPTAA